MFSFFFLASNAQQKGEIHSAINQITKERPVDYEYLSAPDLNGNRTSLKSAIDSRSQQLKLPYPIIFIHGLMENSDLWNSTTGDLDSLYGLTFGGRLDFCLNYDANDYLTNTDVFPAAGADLALFTPNLIAGDYYYLNFAVGNSGTVFPTPFNADYVKSNQSSIVKQGAAVKSAINAVLQKTGRDKVILMGHSMGGLASREYLQNPNIWQSDGKCHVAKLVTTGTPHGGSNSTAFGLGGAAGLDEKSEAVRDLRRTYFYSNDSGVYLFGGLELQDLTHMNDNSNIVGNDFYNVDVNCDGQTGQNIIGLNQKNINADVDYSCIIGECTGCIQDAGTGDGLVNDFSANLNNFYPGLNADVFYYYASSLTEIHLAEVNQTYQNMQGLDEPNEFALAYHIDFDTAYTGFNTVQPVGGSSFDYDDYKFFLPVNSNVAITINNIALPDLMVSIHDSLFNTVGNTVHSNGASSINFTQFVNAGNCYIQISGAPSSSSYLYPYNFKIEKTTVGTGPELSENKSLIQIYPNPAAGLLNISGITSKTTIRLYDVLGKLIFEKETEADEAIDISFLKQGVYQITAENNMGRVINKVLIVE